MSLILLFEHTTKTGCTTLHHATVTAERWVVRGRGRRGEAQPLAGAVALTVQEGTLALFCSSNHTPAGRCPSNTTRLNKDLSHIPNTCFVLINEVYETVAGTDPAGSSGRSFRSRIWKKKKST